MAAGLTHDDLLTLHGAVVDAGLVDARVALLVGVDRTTVASLPISTSLSAQILMDLDELNRMGQLADGSVPIVAWLKNAAQILGLRVEGVIVRRLLDARRDAQRGGARGRPPGSRAHVGRLAGER